MNFFETQRWRCVKALLTIQVIMCSLGEQLQYMQSTSKPTELKITLLIIIFNVAVYVNIFFEMRSLCLYYAILTKI